LGTSKIKLYFLKSFRLITIITAEIARILSDSLIIPFYVTNYGIELDNLFIELKRDYENDLNKQGIQLVELESKINEYKNISAEFQQRLNSFNRTQ
jgi:hypothetical protein